MFACAVVLVAGCECRGEDMQEVLPVTAAVAQPCITDQSSDACFAVCRSVFQLDDDADVFECMAIPSTTGSAGDVDLYTGYTLPMVCPQRE